jgi:hypothetical protein
MASVHFNRRHVLGGLAAALMPRAAHAAVQVDLALVLAIDCSYSVNPGEYQLQMRGTAQAMRAPEILKAVAGGARKQIAVCAFLWSDSVTRAVLVPWQLLKGPADAIAIGNMFLQAPRNVEPGTTATGAALQYGQSLFASAPMALRHVIDISTDGTCNEGPDPTAVRDELVAQGTVINGLAITRDVKDLTDYVKDNIIGGHQSFVMQANDFNAYGRALREKLFREITNVDLI